MSAPNCLYWTSLFTLFSTVTVFAESKSPGRREYSAPPTPPALVESSATSPAPLRSAAVAFNSIGDPTPEEQLYVEMINRARGNPVGEGEIFAATTDPDVLGNYDYFNVDLALMQAQFGAILPVPPVAINEQLTDAARRHSADMLAKSFQEHVGSDGSAPENRVRDEGYSISALGENVYANADSVFQGHAGFEVDWGVGVGGMQTPPGHRNTIHSALFREVGVGVVFGRNQPAAGSQIPGSREVGPQLVTQEFGTRLNATPLITGVVYFDLNGNSFYDLGEGVGGVRVTVSGTATEAITARSGGYAVPVAGNGNYTVTFSGEGFSPFSREVAVTLAANQKVDFRPAYVPPAVTGTTSPAINRANSYQVSAVAAANAYQWRSYQLATPVVEGAENGTNGVTIYQVGSYPFFETRTRKSGRFSFHMAHPQAGGGITVQSFVLNPSFVLSANSSLRFESRLGWATEQQTALVQVSTDNGGTWETVYSQSGISDVPGETSFVSRTVDLSAFAGKTVRVRFAYVPSGLVYIETDEDTGWFVDDITLVNASIISNEQVSAAAGRAFSFQTEVIGDFVLQARALTGHEYLPWGPALAVTSVEGPGTPGELKLSGIRIENGQVKMDLDVIGGSAPTTIHVQAKSALTAAWVDTTANVQVVSPTRFLVELPKPAAGNAFYRIRAN